MSSDNLRNYLPKNSFKKKKKNLLLRQQIRHRVSASHR